MNALKNFNYDICGCKDKRIKNGVSLNHSYLDLLFAMIGHARRGDFYVTKNKRCFKG